MFSLGAFLVGCDVCNHRKANAI